MTPGMDLWTKPITADGHDATVEQQKAAWVGWIGCGCRTSSTLAHWLIRSGAGNDVFSWRCDRVADKMLQRARKAGVIRFEKGRWQLVQPPRRIGVPLDEIAQLEGWKE